jgi:hypothetical protein
LTAHRSHNNPYSTATVVANVLTTHLSLFKCPGIFANHFAPSTNYRTSGESPSKDFKISIHKSHNARKLAYFWQNNQNGFSDVAEPAKFIDLVSSKMESYPNRVVEILSRYIIKGYKFMARTNTFSMVNRELQSLNKPISRRNQRAYL